MTTLLRPKKSLTLFLIISISVLIVSCGGDDPPPGQSGPDSIIAVNGDFYKGVMGSSLSAPLIMFEVLDVSNNALSGQTVLFRIIIGDGNIVSDTVTTDSLGQALCNYIFSGNMGHAEIQAKVPGVDSVLVSVRASTLIHRPGGQAHYLLLDDTFGDVKNWIGSPGRVDNDPTSWINYAVYEQQLGVVVVLDDTDQNGLASDDEAVLGVIVNGIYLGKTKDSLGINSTVNEIWSVYDSTNFSIVYQPPQANPPEPEMYEYKNVSLGLIFYTDTNVDSRAREVLEIHIY